MSKTIRTREEVLTGYLPKVILTLAGPLMLTNLMQTLYNLADTYWVGKISGEKIAAMSFAWPINFLMLSLGIGLSVATLSLISQHVGAGEHKEAKVIAAQSILLSLLISIIVGCIGFFVAEPIIKLMGGTGQILEDSKTYLLISFIGAPAMFMFFTYSSMKQAFGDTVTPTIFSCLSVILNLILDPLFILFFGWGIAGAAIATVLSRLIFISYAVYAIFAEKDKTISLTWHDLKPNKCIIKKLTTIGIPASFGQATASLGFAVLNSFVISFGATTMAAFAIGNRINGLVLMPAMGIGNALATIVGQNLGANNINRTKEAIRTSLFIATSLLILGGIPLYIFSESIVSAFSNEPEIISQGSYYMRIILLGLPLMASFSILDGTFKGSGHTRMFMVLSMGRLWIFRLPMVFIATKLLHLGSHSIYYSMVLSNACICLVGLFMYLSGKWQTKVIKGKKVLASTVQ